LAFVTLGEFGALAVAFLPPPLLGEDLFEFLAGAMVVMDPMQVTDENVMRFMRPCKKAGFL
jgi:hypothetical protein